MNGPGQKVKDEIIRRLERRYSGTPNSVRSMCEMVFEILEHYNDPDLHMRVIDKLLGGDGHGN
jgi:hypothetical protein